MERSLIGRQASCFALLCFVVVMQSFVMNSHEVFIHIHQDCFAGTGAIVRLPQCQWSKTDGYGKISQCITTTKHSKAKTVCIFLEINCTTVTATPVATATTAATVAAAVTTTTATTTTMGTIITNSTIWLANFKGKFYNCQLCLSMCFSPNLKKISRPDLITFTGSNMDSGQGLKEYTMYEKGSTILFEDWSSFHWNWFHACYPPIKLIVSPECQNVLTMQHFSRCEGWLGDLIGVT